MSPSDWEDPRADLAVADVGDERDSRVRYRVLLAGCTLAVLVYLHRVAFMTAAPELAGPLGLTDRHLSYLFAAFMLAYGLSEVPGGLLADRLGVRHLLVLLILSWSFLTGAIAWAAWLPAGTVWPLAYLLALRALFGLAQGGVFPSLSRMMTDWMPPTERGAAQGFIWMSSRVGGAFAPLLVVALFTHLGKGPATFWTLASLGAVWAAVFWPWFRDRPSEMRGVTAFERKRIAAGREGRPSAGGHGMPWSTAVRSLSVWSLCLMYGCLGFTGNFFITLLATYLRRHRHFDAATTAWLSSLPLACGVVGCVLGGVFSDLIIRRTGSRTWGRRLVGAFGLTTGALALLSTIVLHDPRWLGLALCTTFFCNDLAMGPAWAAAGDIGERHAGALGGTMNMFSAFTGAGGAILIGRLLEQGRPVLLFMILAGVYFAGAILWMGVDVSRTLAERHDAARRV
ncbi:MAG: MFS transporter [Isosphaeraceae bacterium]|nr:MFS transporter [Isosphaeraceae bacterium]